jgi:DNA-binding MarR family transcriptional regulator
MSSKAADRATAEAQLLTEILLLVFRVNGQLLAAGDRLVDGLGLTSARWQMLGAVALSDDPRTAPQLGAQMGMTRQAAQKQLDLLLDDGLVAAEANPGHARSPLYVLTRKGTSVYAETARIQADWANQLVSGLSARDLKTTRRLLETLSQQLATSLRRTS